MPTLPIPNDAAFAHSNQLIQQIRQEITQSGGHMSFARFMELALYAPGLGYYSAGSHKFGEGGDFVTAPEISPLFAKCLARQCQQVLNELDTGDILEIGAGSGMLACELLTELDQLESLPQHYFILEISADLRERQQQKIKQECPRLFSRVQWLDKLPEKNIRGVIFANEVLDAMPITCFRMTDNGIKERCVKFSTEENNFQWHLTEPTTSELTRHIQMLQKECDIYSGYESEVNLMLDMWVRTLADVLEQGLILLFDYGYGRREFYHPDRCMGTLMCHYQHHRHADPFMLVGLQDITAHVDFTAVAESAVAASLDVSGYTTQASFLLASGLLDLMSKKISPHEEYKQNQAVKLLTMPAQMGEVVKVIGLSKRIGIPLLGFSMHDRRKDL
jgi:SAM-dependent MidA family methyltransferase